MTVNKTKAQAHKYMNTLKGKGWDFDLAFGWQCYDLTNQYYNYLTGGRLYGLYAKDIHIDNKEVLEKYGAIYENTPNFLPQKGDIFIMNGRYGQGAGHTGIVWSANINTYVGLEQNWYGGGRYKTEVAQLVTHTYDNPLYFWRPNYKTKSKVVEKVKDKVTASKKVKVKPKKILIVSGHGGSDPGAVGNGTNERDFIREYIAPNIQKYLKQVGHNVDLYGGSKQSQNLYADTAYGERVGNQKDYGMYWVKQQKYDIVVELHLDAASPSASGGHVIISNYYKADNIDKNIDKVLKDTVGTIRGIDPRGDLLNANVSGKLNMNYRLVELGFITNKGDMDYLKKNYDDFSRLLAGAISDAPIDGTSAGKSKTPPKKDVPKPSNDSGWKVNQYGTYYKSEKARFTNGSAPIQVRTVGPFLSCPKVYMFQPGGWCDYDEVMIQDGHVWIGYSWKGKRYYLPIRTASGTPPKHSVGSLWGTIS